ncbi:hypothetical protein [Leuconostoc pseudomesenteroides]|uniref:hypothetical protein n=1 Tax=Leuconostoc pseudomesenteroides TaxID=33968 RepID=UPI0032E02AF0
MFNRKKKANIDEPYFARIDNDALDFDQEIFQKAAENAGGFVETYPNVSLKDLQTFLAQVTNDVVRAGNQDLRLGTITYLTQDDKGHVEPTGLSWDDAILTAEFENIVVSTANHVFNDDSIRQDETIDYEMIEDALQPLINAALTSTSLTDQDMPLLPSPEAYQQARELGETITIEATRLQRVVPQQNVVEVSQLEKPPVSVEETPSVPDVAAVAGQVANQDEPSKKADDALTEVSQKPDEINFASEQQLIDQIDIQPIAFPIQGETKVLPAESENYVQARLNADKEKANRFLNDTSLLYTQKVRKALSEYLKQEQGKLADEVKALQQTDVMASVEAKLSGERPEEFESRYDMRKKAREAGYQTELSEENQRHEQKVSSLKADYVKDLEELKVSINQELDDWYLKRTQTVKQSVERSLVNQINDKQTQAKESLITGLKALRDELLTEHSHSMIALQEQLNQDIENKRQSYKQEHDEAMLQATKLASAKAQSAHLGELQDQINALESNNRELTNALKAQTQKAEQALKELNEENQSLQASSSKLKQLADLNQTANHASNDQVNQQLMDLLTAQLKANKEAQKTTDVSETKRSGALSAFAVGSLVALVMGGTAFGAYSYGHQNGTGRVATSKSTSTSSSSTLDLGSASQSSTSQTLAERYHVGDEVKAMIDGQQVTAKVSGVENSLLKLSYNGKDYQVSMAQ